jgi:hypothetical protein
MDWICCNKSVRYYSNNIKTPEDLTALSKKSQHYNIIKRLELLHEPPRYSPRARHDAITSVWLLKRFDPEHYADAKIAFVDAGESIKEEAAMQLGFHMVDVVHLDTGGSEFDHHDPIKAKQRVCATSLVYDHACQVNPQHKDNWALQQIVEFAWSMIILRIFLRRNWRASYFLASRHFAWIKFLVCSDDSQLMLGFRCLDAIYGSLKERKKAIDELSTGIEFTSKWGRSVGLNTSNQAAIRLAQMQGFNLVVQKDPRRGGINIKAAPKPEIDLTELFDKIKVADQVGGWFFHNGRHMIINNSSHANQKPSPLSLVQMMEIVKECV